LFSSSPISFVWNFVFRFFILIYCCYCIYWTVALPHSVAAQQLTHGPAWKAWTQFNATAAVTRLATTWSVPATPKRNDGQILYYWNGVEPLDNSAVLQPGSLRLRLVFFFTSV
jgi:hypothetical protein